MARLYYVTGNPHKFSAAKIFLAAHDIKIEQKILDISEIQAETIEEVAIDKAKKAFEILKEPLFVNDSGWSIPALSGFPGPYMKYINDWFSAQDFINLMQDKSDRTIILKQVVVYLDEDHMKVFERDSQGEILNEASNIEGRSSDMVVSLGEGGSLSEQKQQGKTTLKEEVWNDLANWLRTNAENS